VPYGTRRWLGSCPPVNWRAIVRGPSGTSFSAAITNPSRTGVSDPHELGGSILSAETLSSVPRGLKPVSFSGARAARLEVVPFPTLCPSRPCALPDLAPFPTLCPSRPCALPDLEPFPTLCPPRPCALPDLVPFPTLCPSRPCALPDLVPFPTLCSARSRRFRLFVGTQITPVLSRRLPPLLRDEWDAGVDHRVLHARSLSPLVKDAGFRDDAPDV
jgi:hypothetical protein